MTLFVDTHEPQEVIEQLVKRNLKVEVRTLDSGDYAFGEVGIERKRIDDFLQSIQTKKGSFSKPRLWKQLEVLKATYKKPILLIEGRFPIQKGVFFPETRMFLGARTVVVLNWRIPVIQTEGKYETALTVESFYLKYGIGKSGNVPTIGVLKSSTPAQIKWYMLQCIEGIGPKTARRILEEFPWVGDLRVRTPKEIAKRVKGLSLKKAEIISRVFSN